MLPLKHNSWFENPSRHVFLAEGAERWTHETTGESTAHAKDVAEKTKTERSELAAEVTSAIPGWPTLNMPTAYTAKAGDTLLGVLKEKLPAAHYENKALLRLSYGFMFKEAQKKGGDINFLAPGDTFSVTNGLLMLKRAPGSKFKDISAYLYPWPEFSTAPTTPAPAAPSKPAEGGGTVPGGAPTAPAATPPLKVVDDPYPAPLPTTPAAPAADPSAPVRRGAEPAPAGSAPSTPVDDSAPKRRGT